jgi:hypothetical protein
MGMNSVTLAKMGTGLMDEERRELSMVILHLTVALALGRREV